MKIGLASSMRTRGRWFDEFAKACDSLGQQSVAVDVDCDHWLRQVEKLDALFWRPSMGDRTEMFEIRTKIPLVESLGVECFPNSLMLWLYDDKVRETFFLRRFAYPTPDTFVSFDRAEAERFLQTATFPLVAKTHMGASSSGVILLRSRSDANRLLDGIFRRQTLVDKALVKYHYLPRMAKGDFLLAREFQYRNAAPRYAYFQQYIEADADWRITTFGEDLVSVFVRRNRPKDFRASGSGIWEMVEEKDVPADACDLALSISERHGFTSMAYDFMKGPSGWVIGELSMTFVLNDVYIRTLFRRVDGEYKKQEPIPIGVMHLQAVIDAIPRHRRDDAGRWFESEAKRVVV